MSIALPIDTIVHIQFLSSGKPPILSYIMNGVRQSE
jgi:hypothetical protein